jgi:hypothetical protein
MYFPSKLYKEIRISDTISRTNSVERVAVFEVSGLLETRNVCRILKKEPHWKLVFAIPSIKWKKIYFRHIAIMQSVWRAIHCQALLRLAVKPIEDEHKSYAESSFKSENTYLKYKQNFRTFLYRLSKKIKHLILQASVLTYKKTRSIVLGNCLLTPEISVFT